MNAVRSRWEDDPVTQKQFTFIGELKATRTGHVTGFLESIRKKSLRSLTKGEAKRLIEMLLLSSKR